MKPSTTFTTIRIDQTIDGPGPIPIDHPYIDVVYSPILGPSVIAVVRYLHWLNTQQPHGPLDPTWFTQGLGLSASKLLASLTRAHSQQFLNHHNNRNHHTITLYRTTPLAPPHFLRRLTPPAHRYATQHPNRATPSLTTAT